MNVILISKMFHFDFKDVEFRNHVRNNNWIFSNTIELLCLIHHFIIIEQKLGRNILFPL